MTCKLCSYNWCWLCEKECPKDHFFKEGTPCYGKQFDGDVDFENVRFQEFLMTGPQIIVKTFFVFILTAYVIRVIVNQIFARNANNNLQRVRPGRGFVIFGLSIIITVIYFFMIIFNGVLFLTIIVNFRPPENHLCSGAFMLGIDIILLLMFYIFGSTILNGLWYVFSISYTIYRVMRSN